MTARRSQRRSPRGFTLMECLATMLLMAIILPAVDKGLSVATQSATTTRHRTEAAGLAQSKLSELLVGGPAVWQQGNVGGDFGPEWPGYRWSAQLNAWPNTAQNSASDVAQNITMQQLDVTVTWTSGNQPVSITVSTLVYQRPIPTSS